MANDSLMKVEIIAKCSPEHSPILLTCIKQYSILKAIFGHHFEWPFKTCFTVFLYKAIVKLAFV